MISISVIVPTYNVESYIVDCINSICSQSIKEIEIICIDDGSTDKTVDKIKGITDERIILLNNDSNRGQSFSRNRGLDIARGEYICFVDGDDLLKPGALDMLLESADKNNTDVIIFSHDDIYENNDIKGKTKRWEENDIEIDSSVKSGIELFENMMKIGRMSGKVWERFWHKKFIEKHHLRFKEGVVHEDILFSFFAVLYAKRAMYINKKIYTYRHRDNSTMTADNIKHRLYSYCVIFAECIKLLNKAELDQHYTKNLFRYLDIHRGNIRSIGSRIVKNGNIMDDKLFSDVYYRKIYYQIFSQGFVDLIHFSQCRDVLYKKEVIVYGAGRCGADIIIALSYIGIKDFYLATTDNCDEKLYGNNVVRISDLAYLSKRTVVIVAAIGKKVFEMSKTLDEYGFDDRLYLFEK